MLLRFVRYLVAALTIWAALQAAFLTYQAHRFLVQPYAAVGTIGMSLVVLALLASGALAAIGRERFLQPLLVVAATAPLLLVLGLARMEDVSISQAYAQLVYRSGVAMCFPQASSFLLALCGAAVAGGALFVCGRGRATSEA